MSKNDKECLSEIHCLKASRCMEQNVLPLRDTGCFILHPAKPLGVKQWVLFEHPALQLAQLREPGLDCCSATCSSVDGIGFTFLTGLANWGLLGHLLLQPLLHSSHTLHHSPGIEFFSWVQPQACTLPGPPSAFHEPWLVLLAKFPILAREPKPQRSLRTTSPSCSHHGGWALYLEK